MNDVKASAPEPSKTGRIAEANVAEAMGEIRIALLEADANFEVARWFCDQVQEKAIGAEVLKTLKPAEVMVKIVYDELTHLMAPVRPRVEVVGWRC